MLFSSVSFWKLSKFRSQKPVRNVPLQLHPSQEGRTPGGGPGGKGPSTPGAACGVGLTSAVGTGGSCSPPKAAERLRAGVPSHADVVGSALWMGQLLNGQSDKA